MLEPGETQNIQVLVKSDSNTNVSLSLVTQNWMPASASLYLAISWDVENAVLEPYASVVATLTLTVSPSTSGVTNWICDTIIIGRG